MTQSQATHIENVVALIESRMAAPRVHDVLEPETVEAIDVVNHALNFVHHPRALELWREALWGGALAPDAKAAVVAMMGHLLEAIARGEFEAISRICDCLNAYLPPAQEVQSMPQLQESF
jgi:hypothetical protein